MYISNRNLWRIGTKNHAIRNRNKYSMTKTKQNYYRDGNYVRHGCIYCCTNHLMGKTKNMWLSCISFISFKNWLNGIKSKKEFGCWCAYINNNVFDIPNFFRTPIPIWFGYRQSLYLAQRSQLTQNKNWRNAAKVKQCNKSKVLQKQNKIKQKQLSNAQP